MTVGIRSQAYNDRMGHARRRAAWIRRMLWLAVIFAVGAIAIWGFFFSSWFVVANVHVTGVSDSVSQNITDSIQKLLSTRHLYIFQPAKNIVLLDTQTVADYVVQQHAAISQAVVTKKYPNGLEVTVTERTATGIWCHSEECQFWDRTGARWGSAVPSIGPLLLLVQDERSDQVSDVKMIPGLLTAVDGLLDLGLSARSLKLPDAEPGGLYILTDKKYEIYFDTLGDVDDQLAVLGVFLADRAKDPGFKPTYVDLRTPGRVYYK